MINDDVKFMKRALSYAKRAYNLGEVPVGCVIVKDGKIISSGYNKRELLQSSLAHAEIVAIKRATKKLESWRLEDCTLYVTVEPCIMCSGAIIQSRIKRVVYGALDPRFGMHKSLMNIFDVKFNLFSWGGFGIRYFSTRRKNCRRHRCPCHIRCVCRYL